MAFHCSRLIDCHLRSTYTAGKDRSAISHRCCRKCLRLQHLLGAPATNRTRGPRVKAAKYHYTSAMPLLNLDQVQATRMALLLSVVTLVPDFSSYTIFRNLYSHVTAQSSRLRAPSYWSCLVSWDGMVISLSPLTNHHPSHCAPSWPGPFFSPYLLDAEDTASTTYYHCV